MTMYSSKIFPVVVFKIASDGEFPLPMGDVYFGLLLPIFISLARFFIIHYMIKYDVAQRKRKPNNI